MSLGRACLIVAALVAVACAQIFTSSTSGLGDLGNVVCDATGNRGIRAIKLLNAKLNEECDGSLNFNKRSDVYQFAQTLQPELYGSPEQPHPAAARMLELLTGAGRRQRQQKPGTLEFRVCVKGTFCDSTTDICMPAIVTGAEGCDRDHDCADHQDGYTGVECINDRCLVSDVFAAGEAGCAPQEDNPFFYDDGCDNGDCNEDGTCAVVAQGSACWSNNDCGFADYCNSQTCAARAGLGESCSSDSQCQQDSMCVGSPAVCTRFFSVSEGGSCVDHQYSYGEAIVCKPDLVCDDDSHTCIKPVKEGLPCNSQDECGDGTQCVLSYIDCEKKCLSNSFEALVGKSAVNAFLNLNDCMMNNECSVGRVWKDNCIGQRCFSEARNAAQFSEEAVLTALVGTAAAAVASLAFVVALAVSML